MNVGTQLCPQGRARRRGSGEKVPVVGRHGLACLRLAMEAGSQKY